MDFRRAYPRFSTYIQFYQPRLVISYIRGFKYIHLGKKSVAFAPLVLDFHEPKFNGVYSFRIIDEVFWDFVTVFKYD